jgi:hypothetical protein
VLKQGDVIQVYPKHRDNGYALGLPFLDMPSILSVPLPTEGALKLVNRQIQMATLSLPVLITTCKRKWKGTSCSGFLVFTFSL